MSEHEIRFVRWQLTDGTIIYAPRESARQIVVIENGERRYFIIHETAANYVRARGQVASKTLVERLFEDE